MAEHYGPLGSTRFRVELDDVMLEGFKRVELPSQETEEVEYREGNDPQHNRKLWGNTTYDDLVLERGMLPDDDLLYNWRERVIEGDMESARKNIAVILQDDQGEAAARWEFTNAWPKRYAPPTLDTRGDRDVATETIVVTYDEMLRTE